MDQERFTDPEAKADPAPVDRVVMPLWHGSGCYVPRAIAACPECSGEIYAKSLAWDEDTGQPLAEGLDFGCVSDPDCNHSWRQSDWQPVVDSVRKWCNAAIG